MKKKIKVFTITDSRDEIIAISESEEDIIEYFLFKKFNSSEYSINKISSNKEKNRILLSYSDLYIESDKLLDIILTGKEMRLVEQFLLEEKSRISNLIKDMDFMVSKYSLDKKEEKSLKKALMILVSFKRKNKFFNSINMNEFIELLRLDKIPENNYDYGEK